MIQPHSAGFRAGRSEGLLSFTMFPNPELNV